MASSDNKARGASAVDHREWTAPVAAGVKVGGEYVENPDHIPNATDQFKQYKTSGTGAHEKIEEVSPIFDADRQVTAVEAARALDPDDPGVPRSRVILPDDKEDNDAAIDRLKAAAKRAVKQPVVVGGPSKAEVQAAESGPRGESIAAAEETGSHRAVATNSTRARHDNGTSHGQGVVTPQHAAESGDKQDQRSAQEKAEEATKQAQENASGAGEGDDAAKAEQQEAKEEQAEQQQQQQQSSGSGGAAKQTEPQKQTQGGRGRQQPPSTPKP